MAVTVLRTLDAGPGACAKATGGVFMKNQNQSWWFYIKHPGFILVALKAVQAAARCRLATRASPSRKKACSSSRKRTGACFQLTRDFGWTTHFYDEIALVYHLLYGDWERALSEQGMAFAALRSAHGVGPGAAVLDGLRRVEALCGARRRRQRRSSRSRCRSSRGTPIFEFVSAASTRVRVRARSLPARYALVSMRVSELPRNGNRASE